MRRISYSWASGEQIVRRLSCLRQFCQVIACTLVFLRQQLMPLQQIVGLQYFITQGLVHQNLSSLWLSTLKLFTIHEFLWACDLGCSLRQKSQVSVGTWAQLLALVI
uniref:Auxin response factor 6-like n=1 Tax=Rhizophora mucronata TaxID=61149 RepID=A0A2P2KEN5_RHIMU